MDQEIIIDNITQTSMTCHLWEIEGDVYGQTVTVYQSDGSTEVETQTTPSSGAASLTFSGLTPNTTYIVEWKGAEPETFTTLEDHPKIATASQWADLVNRIKKLDTRIAALEGDSGEGSSGEGSSGEESSGEESNG